MKVQSAIKTITKEFGCAPAQNGTQYWIDVRDHEGNLRTLSIYRNGGGSDEVATVHVRRTRDEADPIADYHPGFYTKTLAQAIRFIRTGSIVQRKAGC